MAGSGLARSLAPALVRALHHSEGEDMSPLGAATPIGEGEEVMAEEDRPAETHTDPTRARARDHPFVGETGCRPEGDRRAMNVVERDTGEGAVGQGPEVIPCAPVARGRDLYHVLGRVPGLTLRIRGGLVLGVGQGREVGVGEALAISEIAGPGPLLHDFLLYTIYQKASCSVLPYKCFQKRNIHVVQHHQSLANESSSARNGLCDIGCSIGCSTLNHKELTYAYS